MRPLIIFDLDGTLVDSKQDLCASVNHVRFHFGLDPLAEEAIAGLIGDGAHAMIRRTLEGLATDHSVEEGLHLFLRYYRDHMLDESRLYPGVKETLDSLADCGLAVLTNKPYLFSCAMLDGLGIYDRFSAVYGGNSFRQKKPDPIGIFQIIADTGTNAAHTWMVGDSSVDVMAGRNAGVTTCGVTYGYAADTFEEFPPDHVIDRIHELEMIVRG